MIAGLSQPDSKGCRNWTGCRDPRGYGRLCIRGLPRLAHRAMWTLTNGKIPDGLCVLHRCDNPACCNIEHLFLGTRADNNADKMTKGRGRWATGDRHWSKLHPGKIVRGERNGGHILTQEQVDAIRAEYQGDRSRVAAIAQRLGMNHKHISRICRGVSWKA